MIVSIITGLPLKLKTKIPGDSRRFQEILLRFSRRNLYLHAFKNIVSMRGWHQGGNLDTPDCLKMTFPGLDRSLFQGKVTFK